MALMQQKKHSSPRFSSWVINNPGLKGYSNNTPAYQQDSGYSPSMLNMMYHGGLLKKRFGQKLNADYTDTIYSIHATINHLFVHAGDKVYLDGTAVGTSIPEYKGMWFDFNRMTYYLVGGSYYYYDTAWHTVTPYVPEIIINRSPDGTTPGDKYDDYNRLGNAFTEVFDGDGTSVDFHLYTAEEFGPVDNTTPTVLVSGVAATVSSFDYTTGVVTLSSAPAVGTNNVEITAYWTKQSYIDTILDCKYSKAYGGANNSRIFFAGSDPSTIFYSEVKDATYFPDTNNIMLGNSNEMITGFGEQYDVLIVFKPSEIHQIKYYTDSEGIGRFAGYQVSMGNGCDQPETIQLINNQLVWLDTRNGVETLVSTDIEDERNVRPISYNVKGVGGITDELLMIMTEDSDLLLTENDEPLVSGDEFYSFEYDGKYWLCVSGRVYCWDYLIAPYYNSGKILQDSQRCAWFIFENMDIRASAVYNNTLYYTGSGSSHLNQLTNDLNDFGEPIEAYYQTPLFDFSTNTREAISWLKTVKNIYFRLGSGFGTVSAGYFTEKGNTIESEDLKLQLMANVYRRKCSIKKVQMFGAMLYNNATNEELPIADIVISYDTVKNVKSDEEIAYASDFPGMNPGDLTAYYTASQIDLMMSGKQDNLVSGTTLKTVDSYSLLGSGNIATSRTYTATIDAAGWTGDSAFYTNTVTVSGVDISDDTKAYISLDTDNMTALNYGDMETAWGLVKKAVCGSNSITFYASAIPTDDIPIRVKVVE